MSESRLNFGSKRSIGSNAARSPELRGTAKLASGLKVKRRDNLHRGRGNDRGSKPARYDGSLFLALSDMGASYNDDGASSDYNRRVHTS